jgi:hypothetical protein
VFATTLPRSGGDIEAKALTLCAADQLTLEQTTLCDATGLRPPQRGQGVVLILQVSAQRDLGNCLIPLRGSQRCRGLTHHGPVQGTQILNPGARQSVLSSMPPVSQQEVYRGTTYSMGWMDPPDRSSHEHMRVVSSHGEDFMTQNQYTPGHEKGSLLEPHLTGLAR